MPVSENDATLGLTPEEQELASQLSGPPPRREPPPYKRAKIRIDPYQIAQLLDLPEGMHVSFVWAESDPRAIWVVVGGEALPEADPDRELPILNGFLTERQWVNPEDNKLYKRYGWSPDAS